MKKLKFGTFYEVIWKDAEASDGWTPLDTIQKWKTPTCRTVGAYVGNNADGDPLFAATFDTSNHLYNQVMTRPVKMIVSTRKLK